MVESLLYAQKAKLNLEKVLENISGGAAASFSLSNYAPRILKGDFNPVNYYFYNLKKKGILCGAFYKRYENCTR